MGQDFEGRECHCRTEWPLCTHQALSSLELTCFVFRSASYQVFDNYFYAEKEEEGVARPQFLELSFNEPDGGRVDPEVVEEGFEREEYKALLLMRQSHSCLE